MLVEPFAVVRHAKGAGRLFEQDLDHLRDGAVVAGCEVARLPVELRSDADCDFSTFLHHFDLRGRRDGSIAFPSIRKCAPKRRNYMQTAAMDLRRWCHQPSHGQKSGYDERRPARSWWPG